MGQNTLVSGKVQESKDMGPKFGLMVQGTKASGKTTGLVDKENFGMLMVMFSKAAGRMTRQTGMGYIGILMEQCMKVNGWMIYSMAKEKNFGRITRNTKAATKWGRKMDSESTCGRTGLSTRGSGRTT